MLEAKPKSWFSRDLIITEDDRSVARVKFAWSFEQGELTIGDTVYVIRQDCPGYCSFVLQDQEHPIAHARTVKTIFNRTCTIEYGGRCYHLEDKSAWHRHIVVRDGVEFVGYIESKHLFSPTINACLPESLPLAIRGFIIALAMHMWTSQDSVM